MYDALQDQDLDLIARKATQMPGSQTKLLVVDDEPELCDLLAEYFGRQGFEVRTAGDAAAARSAVAETVPALAIRT